MMAFSSAFWRALLIGEIAAAAITSNPVTTSITTSDSTCPTTFFAFPGIASGPYEGAVVGECERSGNPTHSLTWNPYDTSVFPNNIVPPNDSLATQCSLTWDSESKDYFATAHITTTFTNYGTSVLYDQPWTFVATKPCCLNCTLFGGTAQVYFWPTPAPSPPVSTLVNLENNFTFISPTVYVAFQTLYATNLCGNVGQTYSDTTIGFNEADLSTCMQFTYSTALYAPYYPLIPDNFTQAHFSGQSACKDVTSTFVWPFPAPSLFRPENGPLLGPRPAVEGDGRPEIPYTFNPCSPAVSIPSQLFSLNSLWTGCNRGISASWDPPYPLTSGGGLMPFSTTAVSSPDAPSTKSVAPSPGAAPNKESAQPTDFAALPNNPSPEAHSAKGTDPPYSSTWDNPPTPQPTVKNPGPASNTNISPQDPLTPGSPPPSPSPHRNTPSQASSTLTIIHSTASPKYYRRQQPQSASLSPQIMTLSLSTVTASLFSSSTINSQSTSIHASPTTSIQPPSRSSTSTNSAPTPVVIGSETLTPGGPDVMVNGMIFSLDPSGSLVTIFGGPNTTLRMTTSASSSAQTTSTSSPGLGGIIASMGGFTTPTDTPVSSTSTIVTTMPTSTQSIDQSYSSMSATAVASVDPSGSITCGIGLRVCQVQDPTRIEAPWHGVNAAFPQCYDPSVYTCADNFLCPVNAPKIPGEYACSSHEA